jgi:molybdopterin-guanine dinucleotide biosynthesis protein A
MVDIFDELLIVTNTPEEFKEYNKFSIISDQYLNKGPLGGIHSALRKASGDAIFVVAGDMPLLDKYLIIRQLNYFMNNNYKVIIPRVNSLIEPLHGIYSRSILNSLEDLLNSENDYSIRAFLKKINVHYLDFEDSEKTRKAFTNINSPSDLSVIKKLLETDD